MSASMIAAVMNRTAEFTFEERPVPAIGTADVLVKVAYVGVCGSDMALFENGYIGANVVTGPMVLGHETSGVVVALGGDVTSLAVGDRVALEPGVPCGACDFCRDGLYNLCPDVFFWASLPVTEGALQEYVRHPAAWCHKLPDSVSLLEGALIEPLSVGLHAVRQARPALGDRALVLGAGSVGLLTTLTLRAAGVRDVMVADLMANRLELAEGLGGRPLDADGLDRLNKEVATAPSAAPRCVFETAGNAVTMDRAIGLCRRGGTVILVGYTKSGRADLNVNLLIDKELTVRTVFRYRGCYPPAIAAVASGAIPVGQVVSSVFPFDQAQAAMDHAIRAKADVTKCVIAVDPERGIRA